MKYLFFSFFFSYDDDIDDADEKNSYTRKITEISSNDRYIHSRQIHFYDNTTPFMCNTAEKMIGICLEE